MKIEDAKKYSKLSKQEKDELDKLLKRLDEKKGRWSRALGSKKWLEHVYNEMQKRE